MIKEMTKLVLIESKDESVVVDENSIKMMAVKFYYADGSNINTSKDIANNIHLFKSIFVPMFRVNVSKKIEDKNNTYLIMN